MTALPGITPPAILSTPDIPKAIVAIDLDVSGGITFVELVVANNLANCLDTTKTYNKCFNDEALTFFNKARIDYKVAALVIDPVTAAAA